jgi:hypothetical protein
MAQYRQGGIPHGFPNLPVIQRSIADLHKRFPGVELLGLQFPSSLSPAINDAIRVGHPVVAVKNIVGTILRHFHLPAGSIEVRFIDDLQEPARITRKQGGGRLVEIRASLMGDLGTIALVAHELAHFFLDTANLRYRDTFENEVLTDTASTYLGAGWSVLNAYKRSVSVSAMWDRFNNRHVTTTTTSESKLGYLTPEEFGYILARRCYITREDLLPWIERVEGKMALAVGVSRFHLELRQPPLAAAGPLRRLKYKYAVWRASAGKDNELRVYDYVDFSIEATSSKRVLFRCPRCTQQLRIPVGVELAQVTCKNCKDTFRCSS